MASPHGAGPPPGGDPPQQPVASWWSTLLAPAFPPPPPDAPRRPPTPSDAAAALLRRLSSGGGAATTNAPDPDVERRDTPRGGGVGGSPRATPTPTPLPTPLPTAPDGLPDGAVAIDVADILNVSGPDAHGFFVALLLCYFIASHFLRLVALAALAAAQTGHNSITVTQAALKAGRSRSLLARLAGAATLQAVAALTLLPAAGLVPGGGATYLRMAVLLPPAPGVLTSVVDLLFIVLSFDAAARLATTAAKATLLVLHPVTPPDRLRRREAALAALDAGAATARAAWSTAPWVAFLATPHAALPDVAAAAFALAFAAGKLVVVTRRARAAGAALAATGRDAAWGTPVALNDADADVEAGTPALPECPICQSTPVDPIRLQRCGHVFCEGCVERWFEQGRDTCPMCRASIGLLPGGIAPTAAAHAGTSLVPQVF